jgi:hypothetical protein
VYLVMQLHLMQRGRVWRLARMRRSSNLTTRDQRGFDLVPEVEPMMVVLYFELVRTGVVLLVRRVVVRRRLVVQQEPNLDYMRF